ncbi:hypothetical protein GLUCOINTEAF2_0201612 [Komagataeibacter intermedius AF2]|uniref:Uncharacterized protein n=1 Tax=Komagataeibacter intermedius AF2 TaxID=1458464 RepID=A0A0N1FDZ3_9PROT|nr:hypothetical protein GLUCOINTEAF2_0201612 [Komagataeibacter intermedius AF2]
MLIRISLVVGIIFLIKLFDVRKGGHACLCPYPVHPTPVQFPGTKRSQSDRTGCSAMRLRVMWRIWHSDARQPMSCVTYTQPLSVMHHVQIGKARELPFEEQMHRPCRPMTLLFQDQFRTVVGQIHLALPFLHRGLVLVL